MELQSNKEICRDFVLRNRCILLISKQLATPQKITLNIYVHQVRELVHIK